MWVCARVWYTDRGCDCAAVRVAAEQCEEVQRVKRFENGFILDPFVVAADAKLSDLDSIKQKHGFSGCPVTDNGKVGGKLVGIVTTRDHDFVKDRSTLVSEVMTKDVVTGPEGCSLEEANQILKDSKKGKLPVVNANGCLVAAISRKDLRKNRDFPLASKDVMKRLLVGASVHTRPEDRTRVRALVEAGVDVVVIDSSQGNSSFQMEMVKWCDISPNLPRNLTAISPHRPPQSPPAISPEIPPRLAPPAFAERVALPSACHVPGASPTSPTCRWWAATSCASPRRST